MSERIPALVMIPGLGATARFFDEAIADLAEDHRVVTMDLPGHGGSPVGLRPATVERAAQDLDALLGRLDLARVTLVGWSLGATVCYQYLRHFGPDRVAGLVSVEQTPRLTVDDGWPHAAFGRLDAVAARGLRTVLEADPAEFAEGLVRNSFAPGTHPDADLVADLVAHARRCDPGALAALLADALAQDWRPWMSKLGVPTLLVHGVRSQVYPTAVGWWLAAEMPDSRLEMFGGSGHLPFIEERARFTAVVRDFVRTGGRRRDG